MQSINLAQTTILERNYCIRSLGHRISMAILISILASAITYYASSYRASIMQSTSLLNVQIFRVRADCQKLRNQIGMNSNVVGRSVWQDKLAKGTEQRVALLRAVLCSVPSDTWIDSVGDFDKSSTIRISGISPSFVSLSEFTRTLRQFPIIHDVQLGNTNVIPRESGQAVGFSVILRTDADNTEVETSRVANTKRVPVVGESP